MREGGLACAMCVLIRYGNRSVENPEGGIEMSFRDYARRNCASDASAPKPPMSGTILNSSTVTPSRSTA